MKKLTFFTIYFFCISLIANATTTYFVDLVNGNDANNGTTWLFAKKTINSASTLAAPSDSIFIKAGIFNTNAAFTFKAGVNYYGSCDASNIGTATSRSLSDLDENGVIEPWEFSNPTLISSTYYSTTSAISVAASIVDGFVFTHTINSSAASSPKFLVFSNTPIFRNNSIQNCNITYANGTGLSGATFAVLMNPLGTFSNNLVQNNNLTFNATSSYNNGTAYPFMFLSGATASGCIVRNNKVTLNCASETSVVNNLYPFVTILKHATLKTVLKNSIIHNNEVVYNGSGSYTTLPNCGAITLYAAGVTDSILNCTVANNKMTNAATTAGINFNFQNNTKGIQAYNNVAWNNYNGSTLSNYASVAESGMIAGTQIKNNFSNGAGLTNGTIITGSDNTQTATDNTQFKFLAPTTTVGNTNDLTSEKSLWSFSSGSYLIAKGITSSNLTDKNGNTFLTPRSVGAYEFFAINHPCLIVTKDMYPALRASNKSTSVPFNSFVGGAGYYWKTTVPATTPNSNYWSTFTQVFAAQSLHYILNYDNEILKQSIRDSTFKLIKRLPEQNSILHNGEHYNSVYAAGAFVNAIIAMDIMHDDFTPTQLSEVEAVIDNMAISFINHKFLSGTNIGKDIAWSISWKGANVVYYLYKDDRINIQSAINEYKYELLNRSICSDGSWLHSPGYYHARIGGDRIAKWSAFEILSFMGIYDFHNDARMIQTMDWANTFTLTPFGTFQRFGDSGNSQELLSREGLMYRMSLYSEKAGQNASWFFGSTHDTPTNNNNSFLFNYLLIPETKATPAMPTSLLKKFSGASFWDRSNSTNAIQGILYSLQREIPKTTIETIEHCHQDQNSIAVNGYGELLIMNSGTNYYPGYPGTRPDGGGWSDAWLQNVVLVDGKKTFLDYGGNGLTDTYGLKDANGIKIGHGLVGGMVEFGETDIPSTTTGNSNHWRTLFFVQPVDGQSNGYFLVRDKVQSNASKVVTMMLHPNSQKGYVQNIQDKMEYQGSINGFVTTNTNGTEKINIFYATTPDSVNVRQAWRGSFDATNNATSTNLVERHCFLADYLRSCYKTGTDGYVRFGTVLFPQDNLHAKATFSRIINTAYSGAQITHKANFIDYFIVPNAAVENIYATYSFIGESVFYRNNNGLLSNYAVANGKKLNDGATIPTGFSADNNISIQMDNRIGSIISAGARVTFSYNGILNVKLDNVLLTNVSSTSNSVTVDIAAGKHSIELILAGNLVPSIINALSELKAGNPISVRYNRSGSKELIIQNKNANNQDFEFTLNDLQGRRILEKNLSFLTIDNAINVHGLSNGVYLWTLKTKDVGYSGKVLIY